MLFGQLHLDEVVGRGEKQDGEESNGEARTEQVEWRVCHSEESLVSAEGNAF